METNIRRKIVITGIIGIIGSIIMIISDIILIGRPVSPFTLIESEDKNLIFIPQLRLTIAVLIAMIGNPLQIIASFQGYLALKVGGKKKALLFFIIIAFSLIIGLVFHFNYAYRGAIYRTEYNIGLDNQSILGLTDTAKLYTNILYVLLYSLIVIASLLFVIFVLKGKSLYPKWMALFNPILLIAFMLGIFVLIPKPIGGFVLPAYMNTGVLSFFIISTIILKRKG